MKLDEKKRAEIKARLDGASSGPWWDVGPDENGNFYVNHGAADVSLAMVFASKLKVRTPQDAKDARFMANARQDVADLLADLETTEGAVKLAEELRGEEMETARQALVRAETAERELAEAREESARLFEQGAEVSDSLKSAEEYAQKLQTELAAEHGVQETIRQDGYQKVATADKARLAAGAERDALKIRLLRVEKLNEQDQAEIKRLRDLIDRDKTGLANGLAAIQNVLKGFAWLAAGEWGSYSHEEQTQETLRKEIGWAFETIGELAERHLNQSGLRADAAFHGGPGPAESVDLSGMVTTARSYQQQVQHAAESFRRQVEQLAREHVREVEARARGKQPARSELATLVCHFLNEVLKIDPVALAKLMEQRVECSEQLLAHPAVMVREENGKRTVGVLGLLNGLIGAGAGGPVLVMATEPDGLIVYFEVQAEPPGAKGET